jgi:hypothetical protein
MRMKSIVDDNRLTMYFDNPHNIWCEPWGIVYRGKPITTEELDSLIKERERDV